MGGSVQRIVTAATAAVQGLASGDIRAAAGGAAPYIANLIGHSDLDPAGRLMAHAVVNAALAAAQDKNIAAGAAEAVTGELTGMLASEIYGKQPYEMDDREKETVSALATLAAGLSGGLAGSGAADMVTAAQAGKVTVENNLMGGGTELGQKDFVRKHGQDIASCADNPVGAACERGKAINDALTVAIPAGLGGGLLAAATPAIARMEQVALQTCKDELYICLHNIGIQLSEAIVPGGIGAGGAVGIGKTAAATLYPSKNSMISNVKAINADEANAPFINRGWNAPYDSATQVRTFTMTSDLTFVRVSTSNNPIGAFLVRADEIAGMTPKQIQQHLVLPNLPTQVAEVTVPAGTRMQVVKVAAQPEFGASESGNVQYQLLDQISDTSFGVPGPIK